MSSNNKMYQCFVIIVITMEAVISQMTISPWNGCQDVNELRNLLETIGKLKQTVEDQNKRLDIMQDGIMAALQGNRYQNTSCCPEQSSIQQLTQRLAALESKFSNQSKQMNGLQATLNDLLNANKSELLQDRGQSKCSCKSTPIIVQLFRTRDMFKSVARMEAL